MTLGLFLLLCVCPACLFTGVVLALVWRMTRRDDLRKAKWN